MPPPVPIPGRECGDCNVCCVALAIEDPALQKEQGVRCINNAPDGRCTIYDSRPATCRTFYCGWRILKWVHPSLRPFPSGVLVRLWRPVTTDAVVFTFLNEAGLDAPGVAESVAAAVAGGIPTYLEVPDPVDDGYSRCHVNAVLLPAVQARDKAELLRVLRLGWEHGRHPDTERLPDPTA